jgi:hypothetical protein
VNIIERPTTEGSNGPKYRTVADAGLSPKPSVPVRKCRKSASTVVKVITCSLYKQQLEMKQNKSKQPKPKTEVFESHDGTGTGTSINLGSQKFRGKKTGFARHARRSLCET